MDYNILIIAPFYGKQGLWKVNFANIDETLKEISPELWIPIPTEIYPEGGLNLTPKTIKEISPDYYVELLSRTLKITEIESLLIRTTAVDYDTLPIKLKTALNFLYNQRDFKKFHSSWTGLLTLQRQFKKALPEKCNFYLLSSSKEELTEAISLVKNEYGNMVFQIILIDHEFNKSPVDLEILENLASLVSQFLTPIAVELSPEFFHIQKWSELRRLPYLKTFIEGEGFAKWNKLRKKVEADWLILLCNRFLGQTLNSINLWISPVWALAVTIAKSIEKFGFPPRFTDYLNVYLKNLPVTSEGLVTETLFDENRIREFIEIGITPLCAAKDKDIAFFFEAVTLSGVDLGYQLLVVQIINFIMELRKSSPQEIHNLEEYISSAIERFFQLSGSNPPLELYVKEGKKTEEGVIPVDISLIPDKEVLNKKMPINFSFYW